MTRLTDLHAHAALSVAVIKRRSAEQNGRLLRDVADEAVQEPLSFAFAVFVRLSILRGAHVRVAVVRM